MVMCHESHYIELISAHSPSQCYLKIISAHSPSQWSQERLGPAWEHLRLNEFFFFTDLQTLSIKLFCLECELWGSKMMMVEGFMLTAEDEDEDEVEVEVEVEVGVKVEDEAEC